MGTEVRWRKTYKNNLLNLRGFPKPIINKLTKTFKTKVTTMAPNLTPWPLNCSLICTSVKGPETNSNSLQQVFEKLGDHLSNSIEISLDCFLWVPYWICLLLMKFVFCFFEFEFLVLVLMWVGVGVRGGCGGVVLSSSCFFSHCGPLLHVATWKVDSCKMQQKWNMSDLQVHHLQM